MKTRLIFTALLCLSVFSFAQQSSIDFEIKNLGVTVDGHFNTFTINTAFSSDGTLTSILGKITVSSIVTGIDSRDEHLLEEDYFNAQKFKYILLESTSINKLTNNSYTVKANLTIKGKTKAVNIKVTVDKSTDVYRIKSNFEINRKDFDVGGSSFVMSKTVKVIVNYYHN